MSCWNAAVGIIIMSRVIAVAGMWLHPCRMFCLVAEHGLLPIVARQRSLADRLRAAGRGCADRARPDLPHALRADRARRRRGRVTLALDGYKPQTVPCDEAPATRCQLRQPRRSPRLTPIRSTWSCSLPCTPASEEAQAHPQKKLRPRRPGAVGGGAWPEPPAPRPLRQTPAAASLPSGTNYPWPSR